MQLLLAVTVNENGHGYSAVCVGMDTEKGSGAYWKDLVEFLLMMYDFSGYTHPCVTSA